VDTKQQKINVYIVKQDNILYRRKEKIMKQIPNALYNFRIPYIDVDCYDFGEEINIISKRFAQENCVIALDINDKILTVCMGIPSLELLKKMEKQTKKIVRVFRGSEKKTIEMINKNYK